MTGDNTNPIEKIGYILRADKQLLEATFARLEQVTGKKNIPEKIIAENGVLARDHMLHLGVSREATAREVYEALISKIESDDYQIYHALDIRECGNPENCKKIGDMTKQAVNPPKGMFLKFAKAREFLEQEPPRKVMEFLGYTSVSDMLAKEDLLEVYCALRFIEGSEWLNGTFFKQYENLTPDDFEERDIEVRGLHVKWGEQSEKFVRKKHHNISHLKELGVVFIIPTRLGISGEILRMIALVMHYLYEVPFYADLFRDIAKDPATFTKNFISLLRGDVSEERVSTNGKSLWLVVQRYLAKDDENDRRLFVPHVNPEALHWLRAGETLSNVGIVLGSFSKELTFWGGLDWVGDYFRDENGVPILVSFNLVDTVMALVKQKEMQKYLYHQQEALWNKIFEEYFGREGLAQFSKEHLLRGWFEI